MSSNLERAQNLADAGLHQASMSHSLIVIAAALKMMVEEKQQPAPKGTMKHKDWCEDPTCGNTLAHVEVDQID